MIEELKDGGPAFPTENARQIGSTAWLYEGMTLRDYFAAKFMARAQSLCETNDGWEMYNAAQCAYAMADAMLEARKS